ncbi:MAG TPA: Type 1 glutamine amidotransferase-like domain-containing protein [Gemmatimonadaceae bacterium]|nr:Type 1 glutamine amidotransferase-like domain-containing protein [Gemmatimonadaceae bacterium]
MLSALLLPAAVGAQNPSQPAAETRVGPPRGTVIAVGGGLIGADVYRAFIDAAGGPDALIVDVPTAGGDNAYAQDALGAQLLRRAGARNVVVVHTTDRAVADGDSLAAIVHRAGGVWFDGGRQFRLVDAYGGTRLEAAFHDVLARGGVVGGSSAGATILGDFLVRGAPSNNNFIMDDPRYENGFAFLRGVAIDQHVVARSRLPDLADSIAPRYPHLLPISEDEGTAWVVRGDTATIVGAGEAFAYQATEHDPGKPFLTLHPGDVFNLATRTIVRRASDRLPGFRAMVDSIMAPYRDPKRGGATVLVALDGAVLVDTSYGIPPQQRYMPTTMLPLFDVGDIATLFRGLCAELPPAAPRSGASTRQSTRDGGAVQARSTLQGCIARDIGRRAGIHRTNARSDGTVESSVDELYRFALALDEPMRFAPADGSDAGADDAEARDGDAREAAAPDLTRGWTPDSALGAVRFSAFAASGGKRSAIERIPSRGVTIIILTNDANANARGMAERMARPLLAAGQVHDSSRARPSPASAAPARAPATLSP